MANTCYGNELNQAIARLIDDYAPEGARVYFCHSVEFKRCPGGSKPANLQVTWAEGAHGQVAWLQGPPLHLKGSGGQGEECDFSEMVDRAFDRWATDNVVIREDLKAAVAAALLLEASPDDLLQELYSPDGSLHCLCEEILDYQEGLRFKLFSELC